MTDLVKDLRAGIYTCEGVCALRNRAADHIEKLEEERDEVRHLLKECLRMKKETEEYRGNLIENQLDRIEKLEAALRNIAEGGIPRKVTIPFRDDGQPSKHDRCEHGAWFYEDCGCCIEDYARKALEGKDD